jgi:DNA-binding CsgD family transcriptional regulator
VRALTEPTAELIDAGEDDLAFRLLLAAAVHVWSVYFAEAAARTSRTDEARKILDEFRPAARDSVAPWTRVALCYADALLADDDHAEAEFDRARRANLAAWPAYRARLLLEYGSWLRRWRRGHEARAPLRTAQQICEAHGLLPWAERARGELRAAGETDEQTPTESWTSLSPQELRIARLAAAGLSNREIGQRLYLSHRTIGSHLYRMFPKLGITSRGQLRALLDGEPGRQPSSRLGDGRAPQIPSIGWGAIGAARTRGARWPRSGSRRRSGRRPG